MAQPPAPSPLRSMHLVDWAGLAPREGARLVPAILLLLAVGLALGQPERAAIAVGGALVTGLGAFQQFTRSRFGPMLFAVAGISVATYIGTYAGGSTPLLLLVALVYGMWCGLLPAIGMGAFWIGQQCGVFLIVSSAYSSYDHALLRVALVSGGGVLEIVSYILILGLERGRVPRPSLRRVMADAVTAVSGLRYHLRFASVRFRFAVRFAIALVIAVAIERSLGVPNGYWIAMTTLILMRPDFEDTLARSLGRLAGTLGGAAVATLIAHLYAPSPPLLAALVAFFAACSIVTVRANYGLFAFFLTAYVVFLLVLAGLAEPQVAFSRVLSTALGAGIAILAHGIFVFRVLRARRAGTV